MVCSIIEAHEDFCDTCEVEVTCTSLVCYAPYMKNYSIARYPKALKVLENDFQSLKVLMFFIEQESKNIKAFKALK